MRQRAEGLQQVQRDELQSTARRDEKSRTLKEALQAARGKREMVKGVLRVSTIRWKILMNFADYACNVQGLILESGLDWIDNQDLRKLMLELGDDDLDASDDEPEFDSDSESDADG